MNAALLILRVFQLLKNRRRSEVIQMTESLRTYASKYLRQRQTQRTGRFLRLLASLPACEFRREPVRCKIEQLREKYPDADKLKRDDGEIIPYETLESILVNALLK